MVTVMLTYLTNVDEFARGVTRVALVVNHIDPFCEIMFCIVVAMCYLVHDVDTVHGLS